MTPVRISACSAISASPMPPAMISARASTLTTRRRSPAPSAWADSAPAPNCRKLKTASSSVIACAPSVTAAIRTASPRLPMIAVSIAPCSGTVAFDSTTGSAIAATRQ